MWTKVILIGLLLLAVMIEAAMPGLSTDENDTEAGGASVADIGAVFHDDGMGFDVVSSKALSNIIIEYCQGDTQKIEFGGELEAYTFEGDRRIVGVWVKSGSFMDDDGPPGAGERFDNDVDCEVPDEGNGGDEHAVCPLLMATANEDGTITVTAEGLNTTATLMRDGEVIQALDAGNTTVTDASVENGVTYTYTLEVDREVCALVEVTAIPVFPTLAAGAVAIGTSVLGYLGVRRRG